MPTRGVVAVDQRPRPAVKEVSDGVTSGDRVTSLVVGHGGPDPWQEVGESAVPELYLQGRSVVAPRGVDLRTVGSLFTEGCEGNI